MKVSVGEGAPGPLTASRLRVGTREKATIPKPSYPQCQEEGHIPQGLSAPFKSHI